MQRTLGRAFAAISLAAACLTNVAQASVVITGTRVIFPGNEREVSVKLDNNGEYPALVQTWIDKGDIHAVPNTVDAPFVIMPPVFRIEPNKGQTLRVMYTQEPLPQDHESVFWLNVLEIPPKPQTEADASLLQMAFRSRIKIFFRPKGLDTEGATEAAQSVAWQVVKDDRGQYALEGSNSSPYHVNVASVEIKTAGHAYAGVDGAMIAPGSSHVFAIKGLTVNPTGLAEVSYSYLNDFGSPTDHKARLAAH